MLQKELAKRLRGLFETEPDGDGWLAVSSDGMPLCRVKYNGNCIVNDNPYLSEEYIGKIAEVQNELLTVKEYISLYEHAPQMKAADVSDYRQLASFGDTVLAATYSEKNGFMFCTWKQKADGDSVFWGDYSPNYEYVKEAFAVRSGLVSKDRLFSENESAYLIKDIAVVDGRKGMFARMPFRSFKGANGDTKYSDIAFALTDSARQSVSITARKRWKSLDTLRSTQAVSS